MSLPYVSLPQGSSSGSNMSEISSFRPDLLNYSNGQPTDTNSWDGAFQVVLLFRTKEASSKDAANIHKSLVRICNYIKNHPTSKEMPSRDFVPVVKSLWELIDIIFTSK